MCTTRESHNGNNSFLGAVYAKTWNINKQAKANGKTAKYIARHMRFHFLSYLPAPHEESDTLFLLRMWLLSIAGWLPAYYKNSTCSLSLCFETTLFGTRKTNLIRYYKNRRCCLNFLHKLSCTPVSSGKVLRETFEHITETSIF